MDSQAIVNTMEVLETKPISELVTEATIKVCWVSETENPNMTVINKEVGRQIAATLPGAPVVGFFDEATGDFVEHSRKIEIKDGQIFSRDLTRPYGFVSFDQPWYQDFMENGVVRTYLMCKAYLWTRQYAEASLALNKGQSMELNENSMSGYYEGDVFVFTQATLDKLCILGDAYAPCFEGAKIMSTYAKQYNEFAATVEDVIGRRYYVLNGKLEPKPEKVTLDYALQLGWNLTDAVYMQLHLRGMDTYSVEGIYSEGGVIFCVVQDTTSLEFLRCDLEITGQDTVVLGTEMIAVTQTWTPKTPEDPQPVQSLGGDPATASQDPASTLAAQSEPQAAPAVVPAPAGSGNFNADPAPAGTPAPAAPVVPETPVAADPAPVNEPAPVADPAPAAPVAEPAPVADPAPVAEPTPEPAPAADPTPAPAADPAPAPDASGQFTANQPETEPQQPAEPAADPAPATDFAALTAQVAALQAQLAESTGKISSLEESLSAYKAAETAANEQKKQELIATYSASLTEEEMKPITEKMAELSVDDLEAKLAVVYARKQQAAQAQAAGNIAGKVQLNIGSFGASSDDDLPEFMKQALEIDKQLHGGITLKA